MIPFVENLPFRHCEFFTNFFSSFIGKLQNSLFKKNFYLFLGDLHEQLQYLEPILQPSVYYKVCSFQTSPLMNFYLKFKLQQHNQVYKSMSKTNNKDTTRFFISNNFSYLTIIHILHLRYHPKTMGHILQNKQKKQACIFA